MRISHGYTDRLTITRAANAEDAMATLLSYGEVTHDITNKKFSTRAYAHVRENSINIGVRGVLSFCGHEPGIG